MRIALFIAFFVFGLSKNLCAQIDIDSSEIKKTAFADVRNFKPTKQIRENYRNHTLTNTSDYFNPTIQNVSNPGFFKDSVYVKAYKNTAYKKTVHQIKSKRMIIGATVVVGIIVIVVGIIKASEAIGSGLASVVNGY